VAPPCAVQLDERAKPALDLVGGARETEDGAALLEPSPQPGRLPPDVAPSRRQPRIERPRERRDRRDRDPARPRPCGPCVCELLRPLASLGDALQLEQVGCRPP